MPLDRCLSFLLALCALATLTGCGETEAQKVEKQLHADEHVEAERERTERSEEKARAEQTELAAIRREGEEVEKQRERRAARATAARVRRRAHLLEGKGAVGLPTATVRHDLGAPDHTQEVAGTVYWYYYEGFGGEDPTEYQLIISGGDVTSINRY